MYLSCLRKQAIKGPKDGFAKALLNTFLWLSVVTKPNPVPLTQQQNDPKLYLKRHAMEPYDDTTDVARSPDHLLINKGGGPATMALGRTWS